MSTRCCIYLKQGDETVAQFYHHHDGYPGGVGRELAELLDHTVPMPAEKYIEALGRFDASYEYEPDQTQHGDLDYEYDIDLDAWSVTCHRMRLADQVRIGQVEIPYVPRKELADDISTGTIVAITTILKLLEEHDYPGAIATARQLPNVIACEKSHDLRHYLRKAASTAKKGARK